MKMYASLLLSSVMALTLLNLATAQEEVGTAAANPQQIAALVAAMQPAAVAPFAGQVTEAIAKMPLGLRQRVNQMVLASGAFFDVAPEGQQAAVVGQLLSNVPLRLLPDWVASVKPAAAALTSDLDANAHNAFVANVLKTIDGLDRSASDKTILATFALALLGRAQEPADVTNYITAASAGAGEGYRDQVVAAAPAALRGDYRMLLGSESESENFRLVTPQQWPTEAITSVGGLATVLTELRTDDETIFVDVGLERPSVKVHGKGTTHRTTRRSSSPVVPPPYLGQGAFDAP